MMHRWQRLSMGRRAHRILPAGRDRARLEAGLRRQYAATFEQGWDPEIEARVYARVTRAILAHRQVARGTERSRRLVGPHVAAIVCAGAAVIAFGGMVDVGHGGSQAQVPPTSSPQSSQSTRATGNAKLSLVRTQPPANVAIPI